MAVNLTTVDIATTTKAVYDEEKGREIPAWHNLSSRSITLAGSRICVKKAKMYNLKRRRATHSLVYTRGTDKIPTDLDRGV